MSQYPLRATIFTVRPVWIVAVLLLFAVAVFAVFAVVAL